VYFWPGRAATPQRRLTVVCEFLDELLSGCRHAIAELEHETLDPAYGRVVFHT
jgi:hypothetical protein